MDNNVLAELCVFLLLAVTMVNVQNAATYFLKKPKLDSLQA